MALTITSTNSVFVLTVPDVFPLGQQMQGYAVDDAFETDSVAPTEVLMGVDGQMSSGFTPYITKLTFMLQANSPSVIVMDLWIGAMQNARESFPANATIEIDSIHKIYTFSNGSLTGYTPLPKAAKVLQPQRFEISWEKAVAAAI